MIRRLEIESGGALESGNLSSLLFPALNTTAFLSKFIPFPFPNFPKFHSKILCISKSQRQQQKSEKLPGLESENGKWKSRSGRKSDKADYDMHDRRRRLHRLSSLREAVGGDAAQGVGRRRLQWQDQAPPRAVHADLGRPHPVPPPQHQEWFPPRRPHTHGRSRNFPLASCYRFCILFVLSRFWFRIWNMCFLFFIVRCLLWLFFACFLHWCCFGYCSFHSVSLGKLMRNHNWVMIFHDYFCCLVFVLIWSSVDLGWISRSLWICTR